MKRISFLSIVLFFLFFVNVPSSYSQYFEPGRCNNVRNTFFGCKLGVSTYQDCYNIFKSKKYELKDYYRNNHISLYNVTFAGIHFDRANFLFIEGRLAAIHFINSFNSFSRAKQNMDDLYNVVKRTYPLQPTQHVNSVELHRYSATNKIRTVVVNLTNEEYTYQFVNYTSYNVKLIYLDDNLANKPNRGL